MFPGYVWGCLGDVWCISQGIWVVFMEARGAEMCLGGLVGSQSLQYGANTLFWHSPERQNFFHLTILRHWNIKMVAYKLSKNGWVLPFFVIFRLAREKLLVTVALDHPVGCFKSRLLIAKWKPRLAKLQFSGTENIKFTNTSIWLRNQLQGDPKQLWQVIFLWQA